MNSLQKFWALIRTPFVLTYALIRAKGAKTGKASASDLYERGHLAHQVKVAWTAAAFYAVVLPLLAFVVSKLTLWIAAYGISYAMSWWDLPQWHFEKATLMAVISTCFFTVKTMEKTFRSFLVSVPEFAGLLTLNSLSKKYRKYKAGDSLKWPWEQVKPELCFSLELVTVTFKEDYNTSDGGVAIVTASFRYAPSFARLEHYAKIDERTIVEALLNVARSDLTVEMSKRNALQARQETTDIKTVIETKYEKKTNELERELGVDFEDFTLADIGYDKETQNTLNTGFFQLTVFKPGMSDKEREDALVLAGKVTRDIQDDRKTYKVDITGLDHFGHAAGALLASPVGYQIARGLGFSGQGGQGSQGGQGGGRGRNRGRNRNRGGQGGQGGQGNPGGGQGQGPGQIP